MGHVQNAEVNVKIIYVGILIAVGLLLLIAGIIDLRNKKISHSFILVLAILCFAGIPFQEGYGLLEAAGGFGIGLCAIGLSMVSREQIGRGDGIVIALIGVLLGFHRCLIIVCLASFIMALVSIVVLMLKKGNRHTRLAFIPALFAGYLVYFSQNIF